MIDFAGPEQRGQADGFPGETLSVAHQAGSALTVYRSQPSGEPASIRN
jgi:hypothetical protein